jgi:hypothetical protein
LCQKLRGIGQVVSNGTGVSCDARNEAFLRASHDA